ncbi:MAG: hypothetical protein ACI8RZ_003266 [Myxococcota bacterium]|jgi:hypothetical protein
MATGPLRWPRRTPFRPARPVTGPSLKPRLACCLRPRQMSLACGALSGFPLRAPGVLRLETLRTKGCPPHFLGVRRRTKSAGGCLRTPKKCGGSPAPVRRASSRRPPGCGQGEPAEGRVGGAARQILWRPRRQQVTRGLRESPNTENAGRQGVQRGQRRGPVAISTQGRRRRQHPHRPSSAIVPVQPPFQLNHPKSTQHLQNHRPDLLPQQIIRMPHPQQHPLPALNHSRPRRLHDRI